MPLGPEGLAEAVGCPAHAGRAMAEHGRVEVQRGEPAERLAPALEVLVDDRACQDGEGRTGVGGEEDPAVGRPEQGDLAGAVAGSVSPSATS